MTEAKPAVSLGAKVPEFSAASTGGEFSLSGCRGTIVVLYFYPEDNTPGCTTEGAGLRRHIRASSAPALWSPESRATA